MKNETIKTYTEITPLEALKLLVESNGEPVKELAFKNEGCSWIEGNLMDVALNRRGCDPFHASTSTWFYDTCAKVTELDPCVAPDGCPELEPWMAYVGKAPNPARKHKWVEYLIAYAGMWAKGYCGDSPIEDYAIDVRTAWSKEHFPIHCRIRNYQEPDPIQDAWESRLRSYHTISDAAEFKAGWKAAQAYALGQANPQAK